MSSSSIEQFLARDDLQRDETFHATRHGAFNRRRIYAEVQASLAADPELGDLIPAGGGIRKMRVAAKGRGKRGGGRVIYFWAVSRDEVLMLDIFPKNVKADLTADELKQLRHIVEEEY